MLILLFDASISYATTQYSPPRTRNYGFTDIGTNAGSKYASDIQDAVGYDGRYLDNNPAHYAYDNMYQNAIYTFVGHGLEDASKNLGCGEYFYNTYATGYPTDTYFQNGSGTNGNQSVYLDNLASSSFTDMLLVVNTGCGTAATHPTKGNFTKKMCDKGCNTAIGFYGTIAHPNYAIKWHQKFFEYAKAGQTFSNASYNAMVATKNYYGYYGGTDTVMLYGSGSTKLAPVRYGQ